MMIRHFAKRAVHFIKSLLLADPEATFRLLARLGRRFKVEKTPAGIYEVQAYEARLELRDARGEKAVLYKHQRVQFLQESIMAYADKAWGDGDIFAGYKCSPGVAVDRYREGHRWHVLISLRETKNRGDVEEFRIERTIEQGFTQRVEDFQTEIDHPTKHLKLSVVFPCERPPRTVTLIEQNRARATSLGPDHRFTLPDGRQQVRWRTKHPRLYEAYILRWAW